MRRLLSYLMMLAILAVGLIPAGWMPAHGSDGKVLLVICTTDGVEERWIDLGEGVPAPTGGGQMEDRICPFSALSASATLPAGGLALTLKAPVTDRWSHEGFTHHTAGFHWRYDARAPPALS
ncbi:DUF2946 domain-containing protein [Pseudophaeobacter sp.]|uniref:DUF2946 domain-containing protein n=1 Tax=Pseudophaeobacter sp. TaxID=1971739 RepID=UPI004059C29B